jgi:hypothetical protein
MTPGAASAGANAGLCCAAIPANPPSALRRDNVPRDNVAIEASLGAMKHPLGASEANGWGRVIRFVQA